MIYSPVKTSADKNKPDRKKSYLRESWRPRRTMMETFVTKKPRKLDSEKVTDQGIEIDLEENSQQ